MKYNQDIYRARALYYSFFANFFVIGTKIENYFELLSLLNILKDNALDEESQKALEKIYEMLDKTSNQSLIEEFDDIFYNPNGKKIRLTASYYSEGVESGKKRVEMIGFVAKTKLRRDEKNFHEYEDSIGFILSFMAELSNLLANGEEAYENISHCVFSQILNEFVDEFAKEIYEYENSKIYKELMIALHSFIEFERVFLDVNKPKKQDKQIKKQSDSWGDISKEERERREKNRALKALGPK